MEIAQSCYETIMKPLMLFDVDTDSNRYNNTFMQYDRNGGVVIWTK